jgi:uncharacterized coiled-coil protein SlyX
MRVDLFRAAHHEQALRFLRTAEPQRCGVIHELQKITRHAIDGKIDHLVMRVESLETRMTAVELRLQAVEVSIGGIRETLAEHGRRLDRIERRVDLVASNA